VLTLRKTHPHLLNHFSFGPLVRNDSWPRKITRCISHISSDSVGRCAIFGFVFLGQKNHKMHIAHLARFRSVGRCARFSRRQLTPFFDKPAFSRFSQIFQPRPVVHSFGKIVKRQVCVKNGGELPTAGEIRFCISWPRKITRCISHVSLQFVLKGVVPVRIKAAVGNSPPFLTNPPFHDFPKYFNHD